MSYVMKGFQALLLIVALEAVLAGSCLAQTLQTIRLGFGAKSISPLLINLLIPEYLGYFRQEGLKLDAAPLGSNAAVMGSIRSNRIDFGVVTASFQLPVLVQGESPGIDFFEYRYPFKWAMAVNPESSYQKLAEFRGKRLGVSAFGSSEYPVGQAVFRLAGLDPEKDLSWLAVGEGTSAGLALQCGSIDGLFYYDTGFGTIEAAGMKLRYLPLPANVPKVGGVYLAASPETLKEHRAWAVGFARAVAKAQVFILENPEAASYVFAQMFPEALPKGGTMQQQIDAVMLPVVKSMGLFRSYDKAVTKWGFIKDSEWRDEVAFVGLEGKVPNPGAIYTNDLIDDINSFDADKVREEARTYKLPYKK